MSIRARTLLTLAATTLLVLVGITCFLPNIQPARADALKGPVHGGWLSWRGPHQNGASDETNLPDKWEEVWSYGLAGQSTPVIADGKLYVNGYVGKGAELQEGVFCFDAEKGGEPIWSHLYGDYLSDIIYTRYASSAPTVDPETGNVYTLGTQGVVTAYTADGKILWEHHMLEEFGRMTFPNGRTATPIVAGSVVIIPSTTSNWGGHGSPASRFYGYDKKTGELIWASQPGDRPRDSTYATPVLGTFDNKQVFWSAGGDGSVYCVNAQTGDSLWKYHICEGGINGSVVTYKDMVIAVHGNENVDSSVIGSLIALKPIVVQPPPPDPKKQPETPALPNTCEAWRNNDVLSFASTPCVAGDRVYEVDDSGNLQCIDAATGKRLWEENVAVEQRQSSAAYGDGKLYIPTLDGFVIAKIKPDGCEKSESKWGMNEETCYGSPAICAGRVYIQTNKKLYCIGKAGVKGEAPAVPPPAPKPTAGPAAKLLVVPCEMLLTPQQKQPLRLIAVDANGNWLPEAVPADKAVWNKWVPGYAKVHAEIDGQVEAGTLTVNSSSVGAFKVDWNGISGTTRGRVIGALPLKEDFEAFKIADIDGRKFAYPPLPWIGARFKWEVREFDGSKCLVKTTEDGLFQRAMTFIGHPDMTNYTLQADVRSDGKFRKLPNGTQKLSSMSDVGLINQRYIIDLRGTSQSIEINSTAELFQVTKHFTWKPDTWYTLKTQVLLKPQAKVGIIRAKVWPRGEAEPEAWTIEAQHKAPHESGSPGIYGFAPRVAVYVGNISATPNETK